MKVRKFKVKRQNLSIGGRIYGDCTCISPLVILSHGFMANQSMCKKYAKLLAKKGYVAVTFDFCGGGLFSSSEGKTYDMSVLTEADDLEAIIDYFIEEPYVDKSRISLLGCSQGGFVSAIVAKRRSNMINRLIMFYPALCIPDDARKGSMVFAKFDPKNIPDKIRCGPMVIGKDYVTSVIDTDAYSLIGDFTGRVLLIHGTKDKLVDISYSQKAVERFSNIEFYEIENAGHGFTGIYDKQAKEILSGFME